MNSYTKAIECLEDDQGTGECTHFLRIRKNQLIDSFQHLERYTNTLAAFGFNNSLFDIKFFKSYLIPYQPSFINEQEIEPSVIKKASDIFSFKHRDIRLLDNMTFLCGATRLNSFLKAYQATEVKKGSFHTSGLILSTNSMNNNYHGMMTFTAN